MLSILASAGGQRIFILNETLSAEATLYETESEVLEFERYSTETSGTPEYIDPELDDTELFNLVAANASAMVRLGGAEMTLSEAMWQIPISRNNLSSVVSMVRELLANRVEETEETEEEDEVEKVLGHEEMAEKGDALKEKKIDKNEPKAQKVQAASKAVESNKQTTGEVAQTKSPEAPVNKVGRVTTTEIVSPAMSEINADNHAKNDLEQSRQVEAKAEIVESSPADSSNPTIKTEASAATDIQPGARATEPPDIEAGEITPVFEVPKEQPLRGFAIEIPHDALDSVKEVVAEATEFDGEALEDELPIYETEALDISDLESEEEILISHLDAGLEPNELLFDQTIVDDTEIYIDQDGLLLYQPDSKLSFLEQTETAEQPAPVMAPVDDIEDSIAQLIDRLEAAEPATEEIATEILDKIIEVPAKLKTNRDEETITEAQAQEELEGLFTELFEVLGIECTTELVESLASLTLNMRLASEIKDLKSDKETDETPQDYGTHEIIKQLLSGLSTSDRSLEHVWAIGKSAMILYRFRVAANT